MIKNLVIYGAGKRGRNLVALMDSCGWEISVILDGNCQLWGTCIGAHQIEAPETLRGMNNIILCITPILDIAGIRNDITEIFTGKVREISYNTLIQQIYAEADFSGCLGLDSVCRKNVLREYSVIFACLAGMVLGGVQEWTKDICTKFLEEGRENTYILSPKDEIKVNPMLKDHMLYVDIDAENLYAIENIKKLVVCLKEHLPCVLVTSFPYEVFAGQIVKGLYSNEIKIISGIRNANADIYQEYMDFQKCVDAYVCVSSDITKEMIKRGIEAHRVHTMICPVNCPKEFTHSYTVSRQQPIRLGYAGRIVILQKRMDLMEKLIEVLEVRKVNYYFELAGAGNYLPEMQKFIIAKHLQEKVRFIGVLDKQELGRFWNNKDICINIADFEGRSRSIAEAMAYGAVPVVTNTSGVHDDIRNGENGYIVDIGDYKAIADRIVELEQNREQLLDKGMKAHIELKEKCNMDKHYQFWENLLDFEVE